MVVIVIRHGPIALENSSKSAQNMAKKVLKYYGHF